MTHPLAADYTAARAAVVLLDRSGEGRLELADRDRLAILHRISTNDVEHLPVGAGRATVLTTPIGRIIDRVIAHHLGGERVLLRTGPGRAETIAVYLRRNVFFRDKLKVQNVSSALAQVALYGPRADALAAAFAPGIEALPLHGVIVTQFQNAPLIVIRLDPLGVPGLGLVIPVESAPALRQAVMAAGQAHGIRAAGEDLYDLLRVEAGVPGLPELNEDVIPLEAGLWDEVSFTKGCYTGQEIIARLESRGKLAKTLVGVDLSGPVEPGSPWEADGRRQGELTSAALLPDGRRVGLGFVKPDRAEPGRVLTFAGGAEAVIRLSRGR